MDDRTPAAGREPPPDAQTTISWRVARPGTPIYGPAAERIGLLREVEADDNEDIIHGLLGDLGGPHPRVLVPRDDVTAIENDRIDVDLSRDEVRALPPFSSAGASDAPAGGLES
jgi:hypothetical protein